MALSGHLRRPLQYLHLVHLGKLGHSTRRTHTRPAWNGHPAILPLKLHETSRVLPGVTTKSVWIGRDLSELMKQEAGGATFSVNMITTLLKAGDGKTQTRSNVEFSKQGRFPQLLDGVSCLWGPLAPERMSILRLCTTKDHTHWGASLILSSGNAARDRVLGRTASSIPNHSSMAIARSFKSPQQCMRYQLLATSKETHSGCSDLDRLGDEVVVWL